MHVFLETERLILRRFTEADVDNLFDLDSDPDVMRYINGGKPTPRDAIENKTLPRLLAYYERFAGLGAWAVVEKASGDFLGWVSYRPHEGDRPDDVELGYRLRKAAWGKGYATEASQALIRKGFAEFGVQRVFATAYQENLASRRVMEKLGMTLVRTFSLTLADLQTLTDDPSAANDIWGGDDVEYALTKVDWEKRGCAATMRDGR